MNQPHASTKSDDTLVPVLDALREFIPDMTTERLKAIETKNGLKMVKIGRAHYSRPSEIERLRRAFFAALDR